LDVELSADVVSVSSEIKLEVVSSNWISERRVGLRFSRSFVVVIVVVEVVGFVADAVVVVFSAVDVVEGNAVVAGAVVEVTLLVLSSE
ncbi:unnamed protein product, partial [Allacma fusca]